MAKSKAQMNGAVVPNTAGSDELPEGWVETSIDEAFALNPRKVPADALDSDTLVTFVPMPAVDADVGAITRFETREFAAVRKGYTSFLEDDVIVAKITPCMENGKAAIARGLTNGHGFGSSEFHVLRSTGSALPEYVYHFVRQEAFRSEAKSYMTGSVGQKRVPPSFLGESMLPLPPLAEQKRIVAKVEALLERVNQARERLDRVPDLLKRFRQSVLAAACSGQLTADWRDDDSGGDELPSTWKHTLLSELIHGKPRNGYSPKGVGYETPIRSLTLTATTLGYFRPQFFKYLDITVEAKSHLWLKHNSILIQRSNSFEYVGVSAIYEGEDDDFIYPDLMMKIQADESKVLPRFLWYALSEASVRDYFRQNATGTAGSMPKINQGVVQNAPIRLPAIVEQVEIIQRVDALFEIANQIEQRISTGTNRTEKITQAILAKAFAGELVETEAALAHREARDYEPASVLLKRIAAERAVTENGKPKRKKRKARTGKKTAK